MDVIYINSETGDIIVVGCSDLGETEIIQVDGEQRSQTVTVNGIEGTVYWGGGFYEGTVLVLIYEEKNLVFVVQTGLIDPDLVVRIAESLEVVPELTRFLQ